MTASTARAWKRAALVTAGVLAAHTALTLGASAPSSSAVGACSAAPTSSSCLAADR
ncbi:MAG: hypothetical protein U0Q15_04885 [Kineosporiaceae bacterium]